MRPVRAGRVAGPPRRLGLFFKVFFGDMSIWAVLSGVLAYEVVRRGLDAQHAIAGARVRADGGHRGLGGAEADREPHRPPEPERAGDQPRRPVKALPSEKPSFLGADEVDELTVAISHMQENLRDLVRHIQNTSRARGRLRRRDAGLDRERHRFARKRSRSRWIASPRAPTSSSAWSSAPAA